MENNGLGLSLGRMQAQILDCTVMRTNNIGHLSTYAYNDYKHQEYVCITI